MIVYLIGHGFVAPHFPQIQIEGIDDLKFYVPEGQLREDYQAEHPDAPEEEIRREVNNRQAASLYNGNLTRDYIMNDGREEIQSYVNNDFMHEHLLYALNFDEIREDLRGIRYIELDLLGNWDGVHFRIMQIDNVTTDEGVIFYKNKQYIVSVPTPPFFGAGLEHTTVYKFSWLIEKIRNLKGELGLPADEPLHICWLACRYAMGGNTNNEFMRIYRENQRQNRGRDNIIIEGVFPPM